MNPVRLRALLRQLPHALTARDHLDLADQLGGAGAWLLRDVVWDRVRDEEPALALRSWPCRLPDEAGVCGILYVVKGDYPLLRPAFLLPLQWRKGSDHDRNLPEKLRGLADRVCGQLGVTGMALHLLPPFVGRDLGGFDGELEHESGWVPLAGALITLQAGGKPRPDVWATGCWHDDSGIMAVEGLAEKMDLARRWGVSEIFIPNQTDARPPDGIKVRTLNSGLRKPGEALRDYLVALECPPPQSAPDAERVAYYLRLPMNHDAATRYYQDNLLPDIIPRCREQARRWPERRLTHLVTVASDNPELILVLAGALGVTHCLILHTADRKDIAGKAKEWLARGKVHSDEQPISDDATLARSMWNHISTFAAGAAEDALAFDVTAGTKFMTLAMDLLARHWPRGWLVYLRNMIRNRRLVPFEERLECWPADARWGPFDPVGD